MSSRTAPTNRVERVDRWTRIAYEGVMPVRVYSTAPDLDAAMDAAAQWHGAPLDHGEWSPVDGEPRLWTVRVEPTAA